MSDVKENPVKRRVAHITSLALAALLCGCAAGPDFKRPEAPAAKAYTPQPLPEKTASAPAQDGAAQHFDTQKDIPADWWTLFHSQSLDTLISRALKNNSSIEAATAALAEAQAYTEAQQGFFYPTVGLSYAPSRTKIAGNMSSAYPGQQASGRVLNNIYNFHVAQMTVGYAPDVFGANRRQVESLAAQEEMQRDQLEAAYLTLASNLVATALQEASLRAQIAALGKIVNLSWENLDILQKQQALGYAAEPDVAAALAAFAQSKQALIPLQKQLEQTRDLLRALIDSSPDEELPETFDLASFKLPEELPLSLPSKLVEQRPDVRAAEAQLHAASAQYGVAIANRLPQFAVTGAAGGMAATPNWMFRSGGGFFSLTADIAEVIFDGGTLRAKSKAAQEALRQAGAQYRGTVTAALQNVADTLHAIESDAHALAAASQNEQAMKTIRDQMQKQYETGYISYQTLIQADQAYQQSVLLLAQAQTNRLGDTAALYQALGGGWWNRAGAQKTDEAAIAANKGATP